MISPETPGPPLDNDARRKLPGLCVAAFADRAQDAITIVNNGAGFKRKHGHIVAPRTTPATWSRLHARLQLERNVRGIVCRSGDTSRRVGLWGGVD